MVSDAHGAPLAGVTVILQRGIATQTTGVNGTYTFGATVPAGSYEIAATFPGAGYQAQAQLVVVTAGATSAIDFELAQGEGCPTCADLCSAVACSSVAVCGDAAPILGTCDQGICVQGTATCLDGDSFADNSQCQSGYCEQGGTCGSAACYGSGQGVTYYSEGCPSCCFGTTCTSYPGNAYYYYCD